MRRLATLLLGLLFAALVAAGLSRAQDAGDAEKSAFLSYVENQLSTPSRQIRFTGLTGALSSSVSVEEITIADEDGIWLTVSDATLVWTRSALLRGRLEIDELSAAAIAFPRLPKPEEGAPAPEAKAFAIPELPLAVILKKLDIGAIDIGEPVFGLAAKLSANGRILLDAGSLDTELAMQRIDGNAGRLDINANYAAQGGNLAVDIRLDEPADGVVANLLNIPDRPPTSLEISGDAPVDNFDLALALDVARARVLEGDLALRRDNGAINADLDVGGPLGSIMAPEFRAFFGETSQLRANAAFLGSGAVAVERFDLKSGLVDVTGSVATLPDGFPARLVLDARLATGNDAAVALPFGDGLSTVDDMRWVLDWGDGGQWTTDLAVSNYTTPKMSLGALTLSGGGDITDGTGRARRSVTYKLDGTATGLDAGDPALARALGGRIALDLEGGWAHSQPLRIDQLVVDGEQLDIESRGEIDGMTFNGLAEIVAGDLTAFAAMAERELAGSARLSAQGSVEPLSGAFDLTVDGTARDLKIGQEQADALFGGETRLAGRVARNETGLLFDRFALNNPALDVSLNGRYASETADLGFEAAIADIAALDERAQGRLVLDARLTGIAPPFAVNADVRLDDGRLSGLAAKDGRLGFAGTLDGTDLAGDITGSGTLGGSPIALKAALARTETATQLTGLNASVGPTRLTGDLAVDPLGLMTADMTLASTNIRAAAALALVEASGRLDATVKLMPGSDDMQAAGIVAKGAGLTVNGNRVGSVDATVDIENLFALGAVNADINARDIDAAGMRITRLDAQADTRGRESDFTASADIAGGGTVTTEGRLVPHNGGYRAELASLALDSPIADARLAAPATIDNANGVTRLNGLRFVVAGGTLALDGTIADTINLDASIGALPLSIINALRPDLQAAGTLNGSAAVTGPASSPAIGFDLSGAGVSVAQLQTFGIAPLTFTASGSGTPSLIRLASVRVTNAQGLDMTASGTLPAGAAGAMDINVDGSAPLAIAAPFLAARGTQLEGRARFNISASGAPAAPNARGLISIDGASVTDPLTNLRLQNIVLLAGLDGDRVAINRFSAGFARGGTVSATGSVGLSGDLPADVSATLSDVTYSDGQTLRTSFGGNLRVTGGLARDPLVAGNVNLARTEITVPESFASSDTLLDVTNVAPPPKVSQTLARIERASPAPTPSARPSVVRLDLSVNAPNQIFVRGRGIDAELGGTMRLTGPVTGIQPVGGFRLIRGRLAILGKRLDFDNGTITFAGDLDPNLNLVARTATSQADAFVTVTGPASNPQVVFSSAPELPQDEILALVIFDRNVSELSAIQIARLANAAAELTGGQNASLIGNLRQGTGLDDLDIVSDDEGNAAVKVGKYLSDNIYFGVQAGNTSEATVNLDITDDLTARGSVDTEGDSSIGIFFEKDY